ncbi:MAG: hypothetical protein U0793_32910 [Gemmataceae bacterium]
MVMRLLPLCSLIFCSVAAAGSLVEPLDSPRTGRTLQQSMWTWMHGGPRRGWKETTPFTDFEKARSILSGFEEPIQTYCQGFSDPAMNCLDLGVPYSELDVSQILDPDLSGLALFLQRLRLARLEDPSSIFAKYRRASVDLVGPIPFKFSQRCD